MSALRFLFRAGPEGMTDDVVVDECEVVDEFVVVVDECEVVDEFVE